MRLVPAFPTKVWQRLRRRSRRAPFEAVRPHFLLLALDSVGEAVCAVDRAGRLIYFNARFEELLGVPEVGVPLEDWLREHGVSREEDSAAARALRGQLKAESQAVLRTPRAPKGILLRETARPVLAPNGLILGAVTVVRAELL